MITASSNETLLLIFMTLGIRGSYYAHSEIILSIIFCLDDLVTVFFIVLLFSFIGDLDPMSSYVCLVSLLFSVFPDYPLLMLYRAISLFHFPLLVLPVHTRSFLLDVRPFLVLLDMVIVYH